jgi:hypothetical protein
MTIIPLFNLSLSWKPASKTFRLKKNVEIDLPDDAIEYLSNVYPGKFIVKTIDLMSILEEQDNTELLVKQNVYEDNSLFSLLDEYEEKQSIDVKKVIEDALNKNIIKKEGIWYFFENEKICNSIKKLKSIMEQDSELLSKVNSLI